MRRDIDHLMDGGWKHKQEFKAYFEAVEKIPDLGNKQFADKTFFDAAPVCFLRKYNTMFVLTIVRSTDIVVYLVGGNPILTRMHLQWLKWAKDDDVWEASYVFDIRTITLQH